jgi:HlyD family secretion protein
MNESRLDQLRIAPDRKKRAGQSWWLIIAGVALLTGIAAWLAIPRAEDSLRLKGGESIPGAGTGRDGAGKKPAPGGIEPTPSVGKVDSGSPAVSSRVEGSLLTVSGYIVAHERIEISPRFMGVVKWIGIKKGDVVTNSQVVVLLDDSEYQARLAENDGQLAVARVGVEKARIDLKRMEDLVAKKVEMTKSLDDARLALASAEAQIQQILGARRLFETWIDWCRIRSPVDGVILEKLAKANELVTPQTFGGTRGPSTSLLAVADLNDLQVDIDVNESDLAKISMGQRCKVSPEAYPDRQYEGRVVEIAPEASRAKGTLQIKVQIEHPDRYLTPELSAKVDFLGK